MRNHLKTHIHTVHKGHKDYKCESRGKSFSRAGSLKKHTNTVHEGHKDHKFGSFSQQAEIGHLNFGNTVNGSANLLHDHDPEQDHDGVEDLPEDLPEDLLEDLPEYLPEDFNEMTHQGDEFIDENRADIFVGYTEEEKECFAKENILTFQN